MHPEVLIIGGGVIGLSIARELHKQGLRRITLVEKGVCGEEASSAAAGMLSPQVEADEPSAFFDLCCASRDLYPVFADELLNETGINVELDRTGTLYLAFNDEDVTEIRKRVEWQTKIGLSVEIFAENEIRHIEPVVSKNAHAASFFPNDGQVENRKLISALKCYADINGIEIRENIQVEKLIVLDGPVTGAESGDQVITAEITVIATGAWTSLIKLGPIDMPVKVEPVRGQMIAFRPVERLFRHVLCSSSGYMVPRLDDRILAGSTSEKVGFDKTVSEAAALTLKEMAFEMVPDLADLQITDQWAGLRPFAYDCLPVLGSIDGFENLFFATAHYRNGILLAPLTAKLVADKLVSNKDSEYFTKFGADRFRLRGIGKAS